MQEFFIRQHSVNPVLEMELINDGRYDFQKSLINDAIQDCDVTFSMVDEETGLLKVAKAPCNIVLADEESCQERYILQFKGQIYSSGVDYPTGNLIVPVEEDLRITIKK